MVHNLIHSFIFTFPLGSVAGTAALRGLEIPHGQQQFQVILLAPHQDETKQGWRWSHCTWSLGDPYQSFVGHSGHMAEPT